MKRKIRISDIEIGEGCMPVFIAGPCVIENYEMLEECAEFLKSLSTDYNIIMKMSYDKANRTSGSSFRGPGLEEGVKMIEAIRKKYRLPVLVDIHCRNEVGPVSEVADCLQIPAFLCRQTDLLAEAGRSGRPVNIKKGQFMSPKSIVIQAEKVLCAGCKNVSITERGTFFGYSDLVVDMRSIVDIEKAGFPALFDVSHSQQRPPSGGSETSGTREYVMPLTKAAVAAGADGLYCEIHPQPDKALSDRGTQMSFVEFEELLNEVSEMWVE